MKKLSTLTRRLRPSFLLNRFLLKARSIVPLFHFYFFLKNKSSFNSGTRNRTAFIVFSKNRPLQLESLLSSLFYYVKGSFEVHVLYDTENNRYQKAYEQLIEEKKGIPCLYFSKQKDSFKKSLVQIVETMQATRIFFLVDDILFKNHFDLITVEHVDPDQEIFSLRHGRHLDYCYMLNQQQPMPSFSYRKDFLQWKWKKASLDWAYVLSVDGHLFSTADVLFWVRNLSYKAPNSFEVALQCFKKHYQSLSGICCDKSIIFNNPCNKVQTEVANTHGKEDSLSQLSLLTLWEKEYRIDFKVLEGFSNTSVHQEISLVLMNKNTYASA